MNNVRTHAQSKQTLSSGGVRTYTNQLFVNAGILTIPFTTVVAFLLLPSDPSPEGALFFSAWALTLGIVASIVADCVDRGIEVVFRAEHIVMVAIVIVVYPELLQYSYQQSLEIEDIRQRLLGDWAFRDHGSSRQLLQASSVASDGCRSSQPPIYQTNAYSEYCYFALPWRCSII